MPLVARYHEHDHIPLDADASAPESRRASLPTRRWGAHRLIREDNVLIGYFVA